jgi:hypothetical protein
VFASGRRITHFTASARDETFVAFSEVLICGARQASLEQVVNKASLGCPNKFP